PVASLNERRYYTRHRVGRQATSLVLEEGPPLQLVERQSQLGLRVHDNRPVPGDRFLQRLTGHEQKTDAGLAPFDDDFIATVEQDQRTIVYFRRRSGVWPPADTFRRHCKRLRGIAERSRAAEHVCKRVTRRLDRQGLPLAWRHRHIEIGWIG